MCRSPFAIKRNDEVHHVCPSPKNTPAAFMFRADEDFTPYILQNFPILRHLA